MDTIHRTTRRLSGLSGRGMAVVLLRQVQERWPDLSPSQRHECELILDRLALALKREHSVRDRQPVAVPLVGRISA